jgi:peptidylprolyl isomerase
MIRFFALAAMLAFTLPAVAQPVPASLGDKQNLVVIDTTQGRVIMRLRPDLAPRHAARIKQLVKDGFYNNVPFHRVISGFMAQTGDGSRGDGTGGSKYPDLAAEFTSTPFKRGVVGMARASSPNSANSQFFIMYTDYPSLNGNYTVIGEIVSGMENVDKLKRGEPVQNPDRMVKVQMATDVK